MGWIISWVMAKDHVCADRQYDRIKAEAERLISYLRCLPNREALRQSGLLSDGCWLKV